MVKKINNVVTFVVIACTLAACGGGGGGGGATATPPDTTAKTTVSGIASKGPFAQGSAVNVYSIVAGAKGSLIAQTTTSDSNGAYSANLGSYTGPVIIEVSGSYQDEATGKAVTVPATAPIRAALAQVQGNVTLPVTPLTELAVVNTGGSLTPATITAANTLVSSIFKVDIIATIPVPPTAAALAGASQAQKDYTLALAAVSQLASSSAGASDSAKLQTALTTLSQGITSTGMAAGASAAFQGALSGFVASGANTTGIISTSSTTLVNVGAMSKSYTLSLQGNLAAGAVKGIQFDLVLPAGITVNVSNSDSSVLADSLTLSGNAPPGAMFGARFINGTLTSVIITTQGFSTGAFATLTCTIPAGTSAPTASALAVKNVTIIDGNGMPLAGVAVMVN